MVRRIRVLLAGTLLFQILPLPVVAGEAEDRVAAGRRLYEIDGRPAGEVYAAWADGDIDEFLPEGGNILAATEHNRLCVGTPDRMTTDPTTLLKEGVRLAGQAWSEMQSELGLSHTDMGCYALHQVGKANHDAVCASLSVPLDRALRVYPDIGNVGACGVPLALSGSVKKGMLQEGQNAALMGIGSGLNCAMMTVRW